MNKFSGEERRQPWDKFDMKKAAVVQIRSLEHEEFMLKTLSDDMVTLLFDFSVKFLKFFALL